MRENKKINKSLFVIAFLFFILVIFFILSLFFSVVSNKSELAHGQVLINDKIIWVEIAKTAEERAKGLKGRLSLADDAGMLFVFEEKKFHKFWMEGVRIPIDIIWIEDNQIVDITENVPVPKIKDLPTYRPSTEVNYVLEVKDGYVQGNNIKIGDKVEIRL